jgi:hypothetical protein
MSETPKRLRVQSQAHLKRVHLPKDDSVQLPYEEQLVLLVEELFAANPDSDAQLIGIDFGSFVQHTDQSTLVAELKRRGYSYQVVSFGGKTGKDTGVLVKRVSDPQQAE